MPTNDYIYRIARVTPIGYDVVNAMVVRAPTATVARETASHSSLDEGAECWRDPFLSDATMIGIAIGRIGPRVILRDCRNG